MPVCNQLIVVTDFAFVESLVVILLFEYLLVLWLVALILFIMSYQLGQKR